MKKVLFILLASYFLLHTSYVLAQEEGTPTPTPKSKIDEIKEKIASTVAQLNLVSKRAFVGQVSKLEKGQLTIEKDDELKIIDLDELAKYIEVSGNKRSEIAFSELDVSDTIVAIGLYNKDSRRLLARVILVKAIAIASSGIVREVDIKDGTIRVEDKRRDVTFLIDIEKATKITNYTPAQGLVKSGLSKIEIGQRAHIYGTLNRDEENRIIASRILLLPAKNSNITPKPKEATASAIPTSTPKPTSTPRPTRKPTSPPAGGPTEESTQ